MGRSYLPEDWVRNPTATMPTKALACVLSSYANGDAGNQDVWPSPETVAGQLGVTSRHVQNLSAEGEALGWWTRIHERNRNGGVMLTWRLHFPEFSTNRSPTELEQNGSSVGEYHSPLSYGSPTEAQRKPNGSPTEAERNHSSDGRYKGMKVRRNEGTTTTPTPSGQGMLLTVEEDPQQGNARILIEAYNELCQSLPRCHGKTGSSALQKAAQAWKREPDMELWRSRFAVAEASDFLAGRAGRTGAHLNWRCDFLWIIKRENAEKIDSGKYSSSGITAKDRELAEQAMRDWNTIMGAAGNAMIPKLDHAHIAVLSRASAMVSRDSTDTSEKSGLAGLMIWAVRKSPWYGTGTMRSGERKVHKALQWCSAGHIAEVHAAYRAWCDENDNTCTIVLETTDAAA